MQPAAENAQALRVLYIVYWGAAEPLGQALVVPSVRHLASLGIRVTLVTFDKADDLERQDRIATIRDALDASGVRWISLQYHWRPHAVAKPFDLGHGWVRALAAGIGRTDLVHARTFFGGLIGFCVARSLGVKLVFHAEGFYPDEMVDGGAWSPKSVRYRVARWLEGQLYERADAVIALSHRARARILERVGREERKVPVAVVPSVVDLGRFQMPNPRARDRASVTLAYSGSIGQRYLFDRAARFAAVASGELGGARLRVLTRTDHTLVEQLVSASGLPSGAWSIDSVQHAAMPNELGRCHAGLFFLTQGPSNAGFSPTKVGEYWACGLPVVTTPDASDVDAIVRAERVGVVVEGHTDAHYVTAARALRELLADPGLPTRCRRAAEKHYALDSACKVQASLYRELVSPASIGRRETRF